ncbi:uncharacterized protein LOC143025242 [Oratosquilla oratoria]|uniref:uncharacterized protein LOC143025242 n=1 Tax=Oratosquilla oratoria TaxID=337810 RepID=UPI003F76AFFD
MEEMKTRTTIEDATDRGLQLPSMTLCNRGFFSAKLLREHEVDEQIASYLVLLSSTRSRLSRDFLDAQERMSELQNKTADLMARKNLTFEGLMDKITLNCEDMMVACQWGTSGLVNSSVCCSNAIRVPTLIGTCHVFIVTEENKQLMPGEHMGFSVILKSNEQDMPAFDDEILDISTLAKYGPQVTLHSNVTYPGMLTSSMGIMITSSTIHYVEISLTEVNPKNCLQYGKS